LLWVMGTDTPFAQRQRTNRASPKSAATPPVFYADAAEDLSHACMVACYSVTRPKFIASHRTLETRLPRPGCLSVATGARRQPGRAHVAAPVAAELHLGQAASAVLGKVDGVVGADQRCLDVADERADGPELLVGPTGLATEGHPAVVDSAMLPAMKRSMNSGNERLFRNWTQGG
jgi:hypothetical protein